MEKLAFDNEKFLKIQTERIKERINMFGDKLYLEFGGKLFDDLHASRVLPGFEPDSKLNVLLSFQDQAEVLVVVNSQDINSNKMRNDNKLTYQQEVERLIDQFRTRGLYVGSVVVSFYQPTQIVDEFINKLEKNNINVYKHYSIVGYPSNVSLIVSQDGFGKNEYVKTTRPLVAVTAPGPGSGKMAVCLSQLYHDFKNNIKAGYAKYETFPVWNLPLKHPVNIAYEAATIDLNDRNVIDFYHLEAYNQLAVNYNRDIDVFPLLKTIMERISGHCPYNSPTDMGVNMVGLAIGDEDAVKQAAKQEVIRRYYQTVKQTYLGILPDACIDKAQFLLEEIGAKIEERKCVFACLKKEKEIEKHVCALELSDGSIVTGKKSNKLTAPAAMILNALKKLAKVDDDLDIISPNVMEPIIRVRKEALHTDSKLGLSEVLMAIAIQAATSPLSDLVLKKLALLKGCQAHSSSILKDSDYKTLRRLGIDITEEPVSYARKLYVED